MTQRYSAEEIAAHNRKMEKAIEAHYFDPERVAEAEARASQRPPWAVPGYQPMSDYDISPAMRVHRANVLLGFAVEDGITKQKQEREERRAKDLGAVGL